ncbi:hypothetical protein K438DRAFT_1966974 [Mycena galopus ATCC 62051]|nr:hypothetical protein K438DRAFT_1966974 [Mycena galopus ATCC 62051]
MHLSLIFDFLKVRMRVGVPRGLCSPRFYASYNFESYDIHDDRKGRFYFIVLVGINAAIYSLKSAAEDALPPRGNLDLIRCCTIRETTLQWRKWCRDNHDHTCNLAELANDIDPPTAVASDDIVPDSEEELLPNVPLHNRRYISVIDLPLPSETRNQLRPVIFPIDAATARKLNLTFDGTPLPLPRAASASANRAAVKHETSVKREPTATPSSKRRRAPRRVSPHSPKPPPSPKLPLWADETPPGSQRSAIWIDDTPPAGGPSLTSPESPTRGVSLPARPPKSLAKPIIAGATTMATSPTRTANSRSAASPTNSSGTISSTAVSSTAISSPTNSTRVKSTCAKSTHAKSMRAQAPPMSPSITSASSLSASTPSPISRSQHATYPASVPMASTSRVDGGLQIGGRESASTAWGRAPSKISATAADTNRPFFYNETKKKIYLSMTRAISGMEIEDELSVMMSPEEIQVAVDVGSWKGKGVERDLSAGGSEQDVDMTE